MTFTFHPYTSDRGRDCATTTPKGTKALHDYIRARFTYTTSMGILNCKDTAYLHRLGWAWDCGIPHTNGTPRLELGMPIVDLLGTHGKEIGLVGMIYAGRIWRLGRENGPDYNGPHPHHDHIHIELTPEAADTLTVTKLKTILEAPMPTPEPGPYADVPADHWAVNAITRMKARGLIADTRLFHPERAATRAEIAVMQDRLIRKYNLDQRN